MREEINKTNSSEDTAEKSLGRTKILYSVIRVILL